MSVYLDDFTIETTTKVCTYPFIQTQYTVMVGVTGYTMALNFLNLSRYIKRDKVEALSEKQRKETSYVPFKYTYRVIVAIMSLVEVLKI